MDSKHYIALKNGCYALSKAEWDADTDKLATDFADGITLYVFTEGSYEGGCTYAFSQGGHWYAF